MNKIYYVTIHGRTFESRDLKELLARAISAKRNMDRKFRLPARMHERVPVDNAKPCFAAG